MGVCLHKTKTEKSQEIQENHPRSLSVQISCCTPFGFFTQQRWSSLQSSCRGATWEARLRFMSLETSADSSRTWIKHAKHFTIFRSNVLLFQPALFSASRRLFWHSGTSTQFLGRASHSEPVAWLNMGLWFHTIDLLCLNHSPLVCPAVTTGCVHAQSVSELGV